MLTKPHLLKSGDVRLWGSAIVNGIITGVSGVQPFFDEMFATTTSAAIAAEAHWYFDKFLAEADASEFV